MQFGQASIDVGMGNKASHSQSESEDSDPSRLPPSGRVRGRTEVGPGESIEEGEDPEVELPPPMRPISSIPAAEEGSSNKRVCILKISNYINPDFFMVWKVFSTTKEMVKNDPGLAQ